MPQTCDWISIKIFNHLSRTHSFDFGPFAICELKEKTGEPIIVLANLFQLLTHSLYRLAYGVFHWGTTDREGQRFMRPIHLPWFPFSLDSLVSSTSPLILANFQDWKQILTFSSGSEHKKSHTAFPMEMQLVHYKVTIIHIFLFQKVKVPIIGWTSPGGVFRPGGCPEGGSIRFSCNSFRFLLGSASLPGKFRSLKMKKQTNLIISRWTCPASTCW